MVRAMSEMLKWIDTTGGPHVLIPQELVFSWKGVTGWFDNADPLDQSDYARACRVSSWLGMVSCGAGDAVVLSGDVGAMAWLSEIQSLVLWIASDGENYILEAARNGKLFNVLSGSDIEELTFSTGRSGAMHLFDSSHSADAPIKEREVLLLSRGRYTIRSGYFKDEHSILVVHRILPA